MLNTDVVLIHPGAARQIYQNLSETLAGIEPPVWSRMIAGWLRDRKFDVEIIDQEAEALSDAQVASRVWDMQPKLVAIIVVGHQPNGSTQQMTGVRGLASVLKEFPTILVGHHVSALPKQTLQEEPVTYVCDGEGPLTIAGLLNDDPLHLIPGLVFREGDEIKANALAPLIPIDNLHGDVWDLLPMEKYRAHNWQCFDGSPRQPYASIYTTLGCPFKCHFCMINVFQHTNRYRMRSSDAVVSQIEHLYREYGVQTFKFADEMFVLNERHYLPICEGLAKLPFADELNIWCYARVDTVKPDTLTLLRKAGIRWFCLGIESGSDHVRDGAKKAFDDQDIRDSVKSVQKAGINVIGNFIFGLPDDTLESMRATLDLAKSLECEYSNFYAAQGYPGSPLFDATDPKDLPDCWAGYSQHSYECRPLPTATLTSEEVLRFRDDAFHEYFDDPVYLERLDKKFGSHAVSEVMKMKSIRLRRKILEHE